MDQHIPTRARRRAGYGLIMTTFEVSGDAYDRFMGRYAGPLASQFVEMAELQHGDRVLDVGCGPGTLTRFLVERVGADAVSALDPSSSFVAAAQDRFPGVDVRQGAAEDLPYGDDTFAAAYAQLVVHFMSDPVGGLREMARVTRPGGVVAACVWDLAGGTAPLSTFWTAAHDLDPGAPSEALRAGTREGHLAELFDEAGIADVESSALTVRLRSETFDDWWEPYLLGAGPAGAYAVGLDPVAREALRARCEELLPPAPIEEAVVAWCARGRAP